MTLVWLSKQVQCLSINAFPTKMPIMVVDLWIALRLHVGAIDSLCLAELLFIGECCVDVILRARCCNSQLAHVAVIESVLIELVVILVRKHLSSIEDVSLKARQLWLLINASFCFGSLKNIISSVLLQEMGSEVMDLLQNPIPIEVVLPHVCFLSPGVGSVCFHVTVAVI